MKWNKIEDMKPPQLVPLLIVANGVVQDVVYEYDADNYTNGYDVYEVHYFDDEKEFAIESKKVTHWMLLPELEEV